jgi:hypothetical protein
MKKSKWGEVPPELETKKFSDASITEEEKFRLTRQLVAEEVTLLSKRVWEAIADMEGNAGDVCVAMNLIMDMLPVATIELMAKNHTLHMGMIEAFKGVADHIKDVTIPKLTKDYAHNFFDKHPDQDQDPVLSKDAKSAAEELKAGMDAILDRLAERSGRKV